MEADSDRALVRRFQAGDDRAYTVFVRRHQDRIFRLACVRLDARADARDAAQEVFLRAYRGLGRFRFGAEPFTWLYRTLINVCNEHNRRRRRERALRQDLGNDPGMTDETVPDSTQEPVARIRRLVAALPERQREVVLLRVFEELSVEETAQALGCRVGTVKAHLHKAIENLKQGINETGWSE
jgi:RNA polymerase sigma-70 factor (ECF subfamily)